MIELADLCPARHFTDVSVLTELAMVFPDNKDNI